MQVCPINSSFSKGIKLDRNKHGFRRYISGLIVGNATKEFQPSLGFMTGISLIELTAGHLKSCDRKLIKYHPKRESGNHCDRALSSLKESITENRAGLGASAFSLYIDSNNPYIQIYSYERFKKKKHQNGIGKELKFWNEKTEDAVLALAAQQTCDLYYVIQIP